MPHRHKHADKQTDTVTHTHTHTEKERMKTTDITLVGHLTLLAICLGQHPTSPTPPNHQGTATQKAKHDGSEWAPVSRGNIKLHLQ